MPERHVSDAERRLKEVLGRIAHLQEEHERLSTALLEFSEKYEDRLGPVVEKVHRARGLLRRLADLERELLCWRERVERGTRRKQARAKGFAARATAREGTRLSEDGATATVSEIPWDLKGLYKHLARRLHPDLANGHDDRAWRSAVMTRLNAAYADEDRVRLELLALEINSGSRLLELSLESRRVHIEQRVEALGPAVHRLERDLRWLRMTSAYRRFEDFRRHEEQGTDYFAHALRSTREQLRSLAAEIAPNARRLESAVRALNAARSQKGVRTKSTQERYENFRRAIRSPRPATRGARRFRDVLSALAEESPWKVAWIIAAFFGEVADPAPEGLASIDAWAKRYEALRTGLHRAPNFEEALVELPLCLELGCRVYPSGVRFGLQLQSSEHVAGVAAALSEPSCATIARDVLRVLGSEVHCVQCRRQTYPVHLRRLRDLHPLQARCCPRCGSMLQSYRAYGRAEGLELLSPFALSLGVVEEQVVRFGGVPIRLEMLPRERDRLTAARLAKLFKQVFLGRVARGADKRRLGIAHRGVNLPPSAPIPRGGIVKISLVDREAPSAKTIVAMRAKRLIVGS